MNKKIISVTGPVTAGKDTQIEMLVSETGFYAFSTSTEIRAFIEANKNDPESQEQKKLYLGGKWVDPEWLLKLQKNRLSKILENDEIKGIILSGSPRTLYEAKRLPVFLADIVGKENLIALEIEISNEEIRRRTGERLVCDKDERHVVSTRFTNYKVGDKCPDCEGKLEKRNLDSDDITEKRINEYKTKTLPALKYFGENYRLIKINGEQLPEKVHEDIMAALKNFL